MTVSRVQANAVKELVSRGQCLSTLSAEAIASLVDLAVLAPWEATEAESAINLPTPASVRARREMQNFAPALVAYFTRAEWCVLHGGNRIDKQDLTMRRAMELSGRNLAGPALK